MTSAGEFIRAEVEGLGPITFHRFMEVALYHPVHGYYQKARDPFGKHGDFFTAEQIQPAFGILIAALIEQIASQLRGNEITVVELGPGRQEMRPYFARWQYIALERNRGEFPERFRGVVFANEFFDALPVHVIARRGDRFFERLVDWNGERFIWIDGPEARDEIQEHLKRYGAPVEKDAILEVNLDAQRELMNLTQQMETGWLLAIDYGYTSRELLRFPGGTLMSYRRHQAIQDVLCDPGEQDITAHVNFTALSGHAEEAGFRIERFESMAQTLLRAGERDQFAAVLAAPNEAEGLRRRMQLKTLLYGMGETFRVLLAGKESRK
jgi:SAM-dependent MidA family methyltransferase